jgi:hypothetical protein
MLVNMYYLYISIFTGFQAVLDLSHGCFMWDNPCQGVPRSSHHGVAHEFGHGCGGVKCIYYQVVFDSTIKYCTGRLPALLAREHIPADLTKIAKSGP